MSSAAVAALLALAVLAPYAAWTWIDHRARRRARRIADDIAALGDDAVPSSIHPVIVAA